MNDKTYVIASTRPWNRGMAERLSRQIDGRFITIDNLRAPTQSRLADLRPRYIFFPHWSYRIPPEIHEQFECIIFHMTDVPYGRGGSPMQNLIMRGHTETMMSALRCVAEMDAGPVYLKSRLCLHGSAEEILLRASDLIEDMIVEIINQEPMPQPQQGQVTVFERRNPEDGNLEQAESLTQLFDMIRMLDADGYPPAYLEIDGFRIEFRRPSRRANGVEANVFITKIGQGSLTE